jgi:hypothetical protein
MKARMNAELEQLLAFDGASIRVQALEPTEASRAIATPTISPLRPK